MGSLYPLTKGDVALEIKGVLQDGAADILNFVLSGMYTGQNPEYENVGRHFGGEKILVLKRLLQYGLLFDTHERGVRDVFLSFPGFLFTDDFETYKEDLEKLFSLIIEKFKKVGSKVEFTSQDLEKLAFEDVDEKRHKAVMMFLDLLGKGTPGGRVISISKHTSDGLTMRAYIDILERGSFKKYISMCIENFNKSLKSKMIDEAVVTMPEISKLIMEIFGQLGVRTGQGLPIQAIASRIDLEHMDDLPWGIKDLIESGYLEGKDGDVKFLLLNSKGMDYLNGVKTKSLQETDVSTINQLEGITAPKSSKPIIFISYDTEEIKLADFVKSILGRQAQDKIEIFIAKRDIPHGDNPLKVMMEQKLKFADAVIPICSIKSKTSPWVWWESASAWARSKNIYPLFTNISPNNFGSPLSLVTQGREYFNRDELKNSLETILKQFQIQEAVELSTEELQEFEKLKIDFSQPMGLANVKVDYKVLIQQSDYHKYSLSVEVENTSGKSIEDVALDLIFPLKYLDGRTEWKYSHLNSYSVKGESDYIGLTFIYSSLNDGAKQEFNKDLLVGKVLRIFGEEGISRLHYKMTHDLWAERGGYEIQWKVYINGGAPQEGKMPLKLLQNF